MVEYVYKQETVMWMKSVFNAGDEPVDDVGCTAANVYMKAKPSISNTQNEEEFFIGLSSLLPIHNAIIRFLEKL
jgi:hypothetical protein